MDLVETLSSLEISELNKAIIVYEKVSKARQRVENLIRKKEFLIGIISQIDKQIEEEIKKHKEILDQLEILVKKHKQKGK